MDYMISMEVEFFLTSVVCGIVLLAVYDMIRIVRRLVKHGVVMVAIEDVVFWLINSVLIFRMMYMMNDGVIRGFSLIGILLGMILYKYSVSDFIVKWGVKIIQTLIGWIIKVIHILLRPLRYVKGKLMKLYQIVKDKFIRVIYKGKIQGKKMVDKTYGGLKRKQNERKIKHKQKQMSGKPKKKEEKVDKKSSKNKKNSKENKLKIDQKNRKKKEELTEL